VAAELPRAVPDQRPNRFRATVHGLAFAGRAQHAEQLERGDALRLIPDPPGTETPGVWVHLPTGEPVGHLPPEIAEWLWPFLARGGAARAEVLAAHGEEVPSWRRLVIDVRLSPA
jgi:hypothetical protein